MNAIYTDGRVGFWFMSNTIGKDGHHHLTTVVFTGIGNVKTDPNHYQQHVDGIIVGLMEQGGAAIPTRKFYAVGQCKWADPLRGMPAEVDCEAITKEGKFVGKFLSDGSEPGHVP
jgi:hypothetical protein